MDLKTAALKLNHEDKSVRDAAWAAVMQAKAGAVGPLAEALDVPGAPVAKIALMLAAMRGRAGVRPLSALVNRGVLDAETRAVVARALAELVEPRDAADDAIARALLALSRDPMAATRMLVLPALRTLGGAACAVRLDEMRRLEPDLATRAAAEAAFAAVRGATAATGAAAGLAHPMEEGGLQVDLEALVAAHGSASSPTVAAGPHAAVVARLRDLRWAVRDAAVEELVSQAASARTEIVALLLDVLGDAQVGARLGAAQALARIRAPEAAPALLEVVTKAPRGTSSSDEEKALRAVALKALASSLTGIEEGFAPALVPILDNEDPFVRAGALLCLGRLADRTGARAAVRALTDPHEHVREAAAVALSEGVREEDVDLVLPLLEVLTAMPSPSTATREAILLALARIHVEAPPVLVRVRHRVRPHVLGITSSLRRTAIGILERCYAPADPPPVLVVDDVLGRLADEHPEVRLLAGSFLAQHLTPGLPGAVEKLEDALDRGERALSLLCLDALRRHDTATAHRALQAACEDPDAAVAARASALVSTFVPQTEEWAPVSASPRSTTGGSASPSSPSVSSTSSSPAGGRAPRVRPARGETHAHGDAVEAKDPGDGAARDSTTDAEPRGPVS